MNPNSSGLIFESLEEDKGERDVGKLAVWSVSSAKPGNGVCVFVLQWIFPRMLTHGLRGV
jgi:hypothetical protein